MLSVSCFWIKCELSAIAPVLCLTTCYHVSSHDDRGLTIVMKPLIKCSILFKNQNQPNPKRNNTNRRLAISPWLLGSYIFRFFVVVVVFLFSVYPNRSLPSLNSPLSTTHLHSPLNQLYPLPTPLTHLHSPLDQLCLCFPLRKELASQEYSPNTS